MANGTCEHRGAARGASRVRWRELYRDSGADSTQLTLLQTTVGPSHIHRPLREQKAVPVDLLAMPDAFSRNQASTAKCRAERRLRSLWTLRGKANTRDMSPAHTAWQISALLFVNGICCLWRIARRSSWPR